MAKESEKRLYAVKQLAALAGVSVRTLHLYDEIGLLKPSARTEAGYRMYGDNELLRLQQILFYKELGFALQEIGVMLNAPDFNIVKALESHKQALTSKQAQLTQLLSTIDKTITQIKNGMKLSHQELYEGFPKEKAEIWRNEAIDKYGAEAVDKSEKYLGKMGKESFAELKAERNIITTNLVQLMNEDPTSEKVQAQITRHYEVIRKFWGTYDEKEKQAEAYAGLGELYVSDERYTTVNGKSNPAFARFMSKAMRHFADTLQR